MTAVQMILIVFFSGGTGWIISWLTLRLLFASPAKKIQTRLADRAGQAFQYEFESSTFIDDKMADQSLLEKMKPEIEKHVDFFLNEKLAHVFPLLYKFMGEKTLLQFRSAFMIEIDLLFPVIIKNYISSMKKDMNLETLIAEKINGISPQAIRRQFFENAKKEILYLKLICTALGILTGILAVLTLEFITFKP